MTAANRHMIEIVTKNVILGLKFQTVYLIDSL